MASAITQGLRDALKESKQSPITKVEVLDGTSRAAIATITGIDDGSVTVDVSRGTRRTFQLRMSNKGGVYSPKTSEDLFSFGRLVRIYRGLSYFNAAGSRVDEYILLGTFMVDRPEVFVDANMSVLTVDGSDLWKKIATGGFAAGFSFAAGTHVNTIIAKVAEVSGIAVSQTALDPLSSRTSAGRITATTVAWEPGDNRSQFLMDMATQWGLQVYFDANGILVSKEMPNLNIATPVWSFQPGEDSIMLGVTKIQNDLKLINHVVVCGESTGGVPSNVRYEIEDTDPNSPTSTSLIGNRVMVYAAPQITTNEQAQSVAIKLYIENALIEEEIKLPLVCLPHLEGNDVIEVIEPISRTADKYLCSRFDVPLRDSRMTIEAKKARAIT
jgi:hypothetical protein